MTIVRITVMFAALVGCGATIRAQNDQVNSIEMPALRVAAEIEQERVAEALFRFPQVEAIAANYESDNTSVVLSIVIKQQGQSPIPVDLAKELAKVMSSDANFGPNKSFRRKYLIDLVPNPKPLKTLRAHVGGSTSNKAGCFEGTIGAAVEDLTGLRKGFITCNHVAAAEGPLLCPNADKSEEFVPGTAMTACHPEISVGRLTGRADRIDVTLNQWNELDAAFVEAADVRYDTLSFCPSGELYERQDIPDQLAVIKSGAGSGFTENGIVISSDAVVNVPFLPCGPSIWFHHQIRVKGLQFATDGDSGALVTDAHRKAVGMIFAGDGEYTYLNPINNVLDALKVKLVKCPLK